MKDYKDEIWKPYDKKYRNLYISNYGRIKHNDEERTVYSNNMFSFYHGGKKKQLTITKKMKEVFNMKMKGVHWVVIE